ncbi:putative multiple inositol polyphosphate phosphatase 1-like [Scophthalmus maximus]|uniref:Putative multiple inositol polyphosphate phosphatase 1-like n=1 Tax=Scophthalmus maximus TaxID=52904 RepID=A0A2U9CDW4_SCOMX|nr:putative multiple inositol polyphosphate phosphatase 1-like [Scophthalmus maximus]
MSEAAFYLCAYEFAIKAVNSPWCRLFDGDDAKVMEYASDLREFWKRGHGYDINRKSSCILVHDARTSDLKLQFLSGQQVTEAVTVQVGNADTLLPLLTLLGFFKDSEALTSSNYATQTHRSFRTSHVLPHAANLLLVLSGQQVTEAVTVQVGNADTLLPLLTLLGFFKDSEALTSSNYATQTHRSFRTSHVLPHAANLLLVLYD